KFCTVSQSFTINATVHPPFFNTEQTLSGGWFFLSLPNGQAPKYFGYYNYQTPNQIFHLDMGFEALVDSNDGTRGLYMYDFKSGHWWYSSPALFPYLYDFTLNSWIYYVPTTNGRYTTNPRVFYNFATGQFFNQ